MPISRSEYQIKITTAADTGGIEKTKTGLEGIAAEAQQTSAAVEAASEKIEETGKTAEKAEEGFKIFGHGAHEAHAAIHALGEAFPGLGEIARFMLNPMTAAVGGIIYLFGKWKDGLEDLKKFLDDLASSPSARGEWIDKQREAVEQATVVNNVWEHSLRQVADATAILRQRTDESLTRQRSSMEAANEVAQAQKALALARLELAEKLGQVTPEQAIKIRLELDEQAFKEQAELKIKEIEAEINARTQEAGHATDIASALGDKVNKTEAAARAAASRKIANDEKLAQDQKNLQNSQDQQAKAEKVIEELEGKGTWGGEYDPTDPQYYKLKAARDTRDAELAHQGQLRTAIHQEQGKQAGLDTNAATTKADADNARKSYEAAQKDATESRKKVASLEQDLAAEKAKTAALIDLHNQAAQTHAQTEQVEHRQQLQREVESGHATPQQQQEFNDLSAQHRWSETPASYIDLSRARMALSAVQDHVRSGQGSPVEVNDLLNEFVGLAQDIHASSIQRSQFDHLRQQVEELRHQINNHASRIDQTRNVI